jgi:hypothetical protein
MGSDSVVNQLLNACTKASWKEVLDLNATVDGGSQSPNLILIASESILWNNSPLLIDCILLHYFHQCKVCALD